MVGLTMTLHTYDIEQRTPQWDDLRRGMVTASAVGKLLTISSPAAANYDCPDCGATVGNPCVSRSRKTPTPVKYPHDGRVAVAAERASSVPPVIETADNETSRGITATLIAERVAGWSEPTYANFDMNRGVLLEPYARDMYAKYNSPVREIGFMRRDESEWSLGFSPDGLVGEEGLLEIKCPRAKTHLNTILADEVPSQYMPQCQAGLLVSGREWLDFASYVGGMPLWVRRVYPDQQWFDAITAACVQFEETATAVVAEYDLRVRGLPVAERFDLELVV